MAQTGVLQMQTYRCSWTLLGWCSVAHAVANQWAWGPHWAAPELMFKLAASNQNAAETNVALIHKAFPDMNCDRVATKWADFRIDLVGLVAVAQHATVATRLQWTSLIEGLLIRHNLSDWNRNDAMATCALGVATIAAALWFGGLTEAYKALLHRHGEDAIWNAWENTCIKMADL
eukprot:5536068-Amphidinium_carterae.1